MHVNPDGSGRFQKLSTISFHMWYRRDWVLFFNDGTTRSNSSLTVAVVECPCTVWVQSSVQQTQQTFIVNIVNTYNDNRLTSCSIVPRYYIFVYISYNYLQVAGVLLDVYEYKLNFSKKQACKNLVQTYRFTHC